MPHEDDLSAESVESVPDDDGSIASFFRRNGIDSIQEEDAVLASVGCRIPSSLWEHVSLTQGQLDMLKRLYGYA
jgi:hypothetical protein